MAEIQENSGGRLFPMGLIPWWDIEGPMGWFGTSPWPSQGDDQKPAIGSAMMYLANAAESG